MLISNISTVKLLLTAHKVLLKQVRGVSNHSKRVSLLFCFVFSLCEVVTAYVNMHFRQSVKKKRKSSAGVV